MNAGESFVKWIRPAGAAVILGLFIIVTIMLLFTILLCECRKQMVALV